MRACSEIVVGRSFGFGTELSKHETKHLHTPTGMYVLVHRRLEHRVNLACKSSECMQRVGTEVHSKADTVYDNLQGTMY